MNGKFWTKLQDEYLKANYANVHNKEICEYLNRTYSSIYQRAYYWGLKKSIELKRLTYWKKGENQGKATQFKKGNIPANKGKKMSKDIYERCKATMFKKGNKPHNTLYNGALTMRKDKNNRKHVFIRISEEVWRPLHQVIWEKHNGTIPDNYNIVFKDKNQFNFNIDNLECISNAELMERNTIHQWSKEFEQLIRLNSKLKKEIHNQLNTQ